MSVFTNDYNKFGDGELAPIRSLADAELQKRLRWYKRQVAKRYEIVKPPRLGRDLRGDKYWVSTKIDGQLWFIIKKDGEVAAIAYNGRVLRGVPVVDEAAKHLAGIDDAIIPGELFAIPPNQEGRPTFHHIAFALGDGGQAKRIGFKAFDLVELDGEDWFGKDYGERYDKLVELMGKGKRCSVVTTEIIEKPEDAVAFYQEWVTSKKAEGLVIRSDNRITFKCKPAVSLDVVVLAFGERRAPDIGQVRDISVGVVRDDGTYHLVGTVGSGFSDQDRLDWFDRLSAIEVPSAFRLANREGTLCRFVRPEIAIEIKVSDLLAFEADDSPVRKMVLQYDANEGFRALGQMPILSLVHPTFIRERDDKTVDAVNTGVDQMWKVVPFDNPHDVAEEEDLPEAEILDRQVFVKEAKGSQMVRKVVAIATNKAEDDPRFPPFVTYFTDFSPNRKDPLKTSLSVASDRELQEQQVADWLAKNIKRGWNRHEA